jgi:hypothetical protein
METFFFSNYAHTQTIYTVLNSVFCFQGGTTSNKTQSVFMPQPPNPNTNINSSPHTPPSAKQNRLCAASAEIKMVLLEFL